MSWSDDPRTLVGVVADDLTGANATGILLRHRQFRTVSLTGMEWPAGGLVGFDCVCINTESRALPAAEAYQKVKTAAELIQANRGRPLAKRVDSTLRGNLGSEVEAILDVLGPQSLAVVTGAFPSSGRTTRDGIHYVGGVPLADTEVREDPLCPIRESHVPTLLAAQTKWKIDTLPLATVRSGAEAVAGELVKMAAAGVRMVCPDAETDDDIRSLGLGMSMSGLTCVAADPGPLTAAYAATLAANRRQRVLVIAGSVIPTTREQLDHLEQEMGAHLVLVDAARLSKGGDEAALEVRRVVDALIALPIDTAIAGVRTTPLIDLPNHLAALAIAEGFAEIAAQALKSLPDIASLYTTGGDITIAVCRRIGATAINLVNEVMPRAVAGRLLGGDQPGLPIVTKGGLVGGPDAAVICVSHLLKEVTRA